ncbi:MAG: biotin--[acetyl-CoA-carboxylase] ligase [Cetobacterium sp.]
MKIFKYEELDSTNKFIKSLDNLQEYDIVIAKKQTAGRGRRGNPWTTELGAGLFSFLVEEKEGISIEEYTKLPLIIGYSVLKGLKKIENLDYKFKWTNDVYVQDKKISGILVEKMENKFVIGIGININNKMHSSVENIGISLREITGKEYSIDEVVIEVVEEFKKNYDKFINGKWEEILLEINKLNYLFGKRIKISGIGEIQEGIAGDILEDGRLEVYIGDIKKAFNIGEIHIAK